MPVFDTSSVVYAWDNYPIDQFPGLWEWLADQIRNGELVLPYVAFDEVYKKDPDCAGWLKRNNIKILKMTNDIIQMALRIKNMLRIEGDNYHSKGVGENDLFIIATACVHKRELVSDESRQPKLPDVPANYKIPAVCQQREVSVQCISFIEFIKRSRVVFR